MGCDINLWIEKREGSLWSPCIEIPYCLLPDDRNYDVFGFLAGVRSNENGQFNNRGIPEDTSAPEVELGDHSFTYAYLDELLKAPWQRENLHESYFYIFCLHVLPRLLGKYGYLSPDEERNIRIVMGFDS